MGWVHRWKIWTVCSFKGGGSMKKGMFLIPQYTLWKGATLKLFSLIEYQINIFTEKSSKKYAPQASLLG